MVFELRLLHVWCNRLLSDRIKVFENNMRVLFVIIIRRCIFLNSLDERLTANYGNDVFDNIRIIVNLWCSFENDEWVVNLRSATKSFIITRVMYFIIAIMPIIDMCVRWLCIQIHYIVDDMFLISNNFFKNNELKLYYLIFMHYCNYTKIIIYHLNYIVLI